MENKFLYINAREISELLSIDDCINVMSDALTAYSGGNVVQPLRTPIFLSPNSRDKVLGLMPASITHPFKICGIKVITVFSNVAHSHQGAVLLFQGDENGKLVAMLNADEITSIRTAACSGVATKLLRTKSNQLKVAILGTGTQAKSHLISVLGADIHEISVWGRSEDKVKEFIKENGHSVKVPFKACSTVQETVEGADIINVVTSSPTPVLKGEWIKKGAHINAVGACTPSRRELDTECVKKATLFVDSKESALAESGDILIPIKENSLTAEHIRGEIGEIILGKKQGRTSDEEITLFKSLGIAVEDLYAGHFIYQKAKKEKVGTWLEI